MRKRETLEILQNHNLKDEKLTVKLLGLAANVTLMSKKSSTSGTVVSIKGFKVAKSMSFRSWPIVAGIGEEASLRVSNGSSNGGGPKMKPMKFKKIIFEGNFDICDSPGLSLLEGVFEEPLEVFKAPLFGR